MNELVKDLKMANDNLYCANKMLEKENKRLHSIIKEVREYIRSNEWGKDYERSSCRTHLLEILNKENK